MVAIPLKHEIPGQNKVIPGSLDKLSKSVISLDCPGQPWTVGNYGSGSEECSSQTTAHKKLQS